VIRWPCPFAHASGLRLNEAFSTGSGIYAVQEEMGADLVYN